MKHLKRIVKIVHTRHMLMSWDAKGASMISLVQHVMRKVHTDLKSKVVQAKPVYKILKECK